MTGDQYLISGHWGSRLESAEAIAGRLLTLLDRLALVDPVFGTWFWARVLPPVPFATIRSRIIDEIACCGALYRFGPKYSNEGYKIIFGNTEDRSPRGIMIHMKVGSGADGGLATNSVVIHTHFNVEPDPAIITYDVFKPALLALAETFALDWCLAYPSSGSLRGLKRTRFHHAWMSYLAPAFAPLVTPPTTAIVEVRPDGGLFMAATDETYIDSNPVHQAVARDIEAAVAPLKAFELRTAPDNLG